MEGTAKRARVAQVAWDVQEFDSAVVSTSTAGRGTSAPSRYTALTADSRCTSRAVPVTLDFGGGDGNACVEISNRRPRIAIRDSKAPAYGTLTVPAEAFSSFVEALKAPSAT
jgi:hypothetical protein